MILKKIIPLLVVLWATATAAFAQKGADEAFLAAYDAYRAGDAIKLSRIAPKFEGHVLAPWLDYWRISMRLEDATASDVNAFNAAHGTTYVGERLRGEWLKVLGRRRSWAEFELALPGYARDDLEIKCFAWESRIARGDNAALDEAMAMWLEPKELPEGCARLADALSEKGRIGVTDVWRRVRVLFENGQITAAKSALALLPREEAPDERSLADAARTPRRLIDKLPRNLERRATREVVVLAGVRLARVETQYAAEALAGSLGERLPEADAKYLWGRVAYEGARTLNEQALKWYQRAGDTRLDDEQLMWKARVALRRAKWATVRDAVDRMSPAARQDPAWTYWYGRALAAQGEEAGARAYFTRIAGQPDFYGLLANEELGYVATPPESAYQPKEAEVAAMAREPGLARALDLLRLGMRLEGVREWLFTIRHLDDQRLIAAAQLACRHEVYDRCINTADRTTATHNFLLRYPVPYRDVFNEYARTNGIEEAWVLGIVRQESRFNPIAKSSAGAQGLMQLMPATARYVAAKVGLKPYDHKRVTDVRTNVNLGTGYMKMVLDQLGHPVLASAAYNAGPGRARRWRDAKPLEGAIYAESIPFNETRDYVKKVMANSVFYAALLERKLTPLKQRLGTIPAKVAGETFDEELP
jgi:soluble lytic murein transglycosylase